MQRKLQRRHEKVEELELMNTSDPRIAWKSTKEIASGLFGHHTSSISMKMRKKTGEYAKNVLENVQYMFSKKSSKSSTTTTKAQSMTNQYWMK